MSRGRGVLGGVALLTAVALAAPAAFAAGPSVTNQGYPCATAPPAAPGAGAGMCATNGVAGASKSVGRAAAAPSGVAPATVSRGTLPFTGIQLGLFVLVGIALLAGGMVLRRSGRGHPTA